MVQLKDDMVMLQHVLGLQRSADSHANLKPKDHHEMETIKAAEPVFICIDLEAYEYDQNKITEIGISTLDTRNVVGTDPGVDASEWLSKIDYNHYVIREYKRFVNRRFLAGCPDKFNFGTSISLPLRSIHNTLTFHFRNPSPATRSPGEKRNLILVGHGLSNDTAYLKKLEFAPHADGNVILDLDTAKLAGSSKKNTVGLARMVKGLGVDAQNLHNAGNDAAYTLQALVIMAVKHTREPGAFIKAIVAAEVVKDPRKKQTYKQYKAAQKVLVAEQEAKGAEETGAKPMVQPEKEKPPEITERTPENPSTTANLGPSELHDDELSRPMDFGNNDRQQLSEPEHDENTIRIVHEKSEYDDSLILGIMHPEPEPEDDENHVARRVPVDFKGPHQRRRFARNMLVLQRSLLSQDKNAGQQPTTSISSETAAATESQDLAEPATVFECLERERKARKQEKIKHNDRPHFKTLKADTKQGDAKTASNNTILTNSRSESQSTNASASSSQESQGSLRDMTMSETETGKRPLNDRERRQQRERRKLRRLEEDMHASEWSNPGFGPENSTRKPEKRAPETYPLRKKKIRESERGGRDKVEEDDGWFDITPW